jgi:hypothetical protein
LQRQQIKADAACIVSQAQVIILDDDQTGLSGFSVRTLPVHPVLLISAFHPMASSYSRPPKKAQTTCYTQLHLTGLARKEAMA